MKLAEFNALCDREWREARGDVIGLCLTDESLAELRADLGFKFMDPCGLVNPVTRSVAQVTGEAAIDSAEVRRYYGSQHVPVPVSKEVALEAVRSLGAAQRKTAQDLRDAIRTAKGAGVSWSDIGRALGVVRETVFRQYQAGSPIVVVKARQNPKP